MARKKVTTPEAVEEQVVEEVKVVKEEKKAPKAKTEVKNETGFGVVNCERLFVRKKPDKSAGIATVIMQGTKVKILEKCAEPFYKVRVNNIEGYCAKGYIDLE